jgi:ABC-type branched-subunit amino acid transport system ATPase component
MLAIGRVLMLQPRVVILDEPTSNLSPALAREVLEEHVKALADAGAAILLVEQKAKEALEIGNWAYVLVAGLVHLSEPAAELLGRDDIAELFLGHVPVAEAR